MRPGSAASALRCQPAGVLGNEPVPSRFTWTDDVAGFALTREVAGGVVSSEGDVVSVVEL